jgi:hypothetical protein
MNRVRARVPVSLTSFTQKTSFTRQISHLKIKPDEWPWRSLFRRVA